MNTSRVLLVPDYWQPGQLSPGSYRATCMDAHGAKYSFKKLIDYDAIFMFLDQR